MVSHVASDWKGRPARSKRTPIPVPRHARSQRRLRALRPTTRCARQPDIRRAGQRRRARADAVVARDALLAPPRVLVPAVLAGARLGALGVEFGLLVERDGEVGVRVAEDVPAVAAVVAALEEREGLLADGRVADGGVGVGFPVLARGQAGYVAERGGEGRSLLDTFVSYVLALAVAC